MESISERRRRRIRSRFPRIKLNDYIPELAERSMEFGSRPEAPGMHPVDLVADVVGFVN
jgi:hypothetical protein